MGRLRFRPIELWCWPDGNLSGTTTQDRQVSPASSGGTVTRATPRFVADWWDSLVIGPRIVPSACPIRCHLHHPHRRRAFGRPVVGVIGSKPIAGCLQLGRSALAGWLVARLIGWFGAKRSESTRGRRPHSRNGAPRREIAPSLGGIRSRVVVVVAAAAAAAAAAALSRSITAVQSFRPFLPGLRKHDHDAGVG